MSERFWIRNASVHASLLDRPLADLPTSDDGFTPLDLEIAAGRVAAIRARLGVAIGPRDIDMREGQVWPCFVDLHAHLDKGHVWPRGPNPAGNRTGALAAVSADREACWTRADVRRRMEFGLRCAWAHGTRAIRSHLDSHWSRPDANWAAALEVRAAWADRITLQLVGFAPLELFADPAGEALADRAARAEGLLGAVVHAVTPELDGLLDRLLALANERDLDLDLHCDESEAASFTLPRVASAVLRAGFRRQVVCGHCTTLTLQGRDEAEAALDLVKRAGIAIVSLPLTNLYLQDTEGGCTPRWRGVTLVHELHARGVPVAVGGDNCRDPFHAFGDHDMLEVFREAVRIAHLDRPYGHWPRAVTTTPARIMRLADPGGIAVGQPADLVLFSARDFSELLARPQADRRVLRAGVPIDTGYPTTASWTTWCDDDDGGPLMEPLAKPPAAYRAYRIEASSTNRLVLVFDPIEDGVPFVHCVEIWDEGGAQPPNVHPNAEEIFYVLKGRAIAHCDGRTFPLEPGDSFLARRGQTHRIVNAGPGRLYALCTMIPDDHFAALIRAGVPAELDAEDLAVLRRLA